MKTELEIVNGLISKVENGEIQSKYLVTIHLDNQLMYWKDTYYEVEKNGIIDAFLMGRWNYEPGAIMIIKEFNLPSSTPSKQHELTFLAHGIEVVIKQ